MTYRYQYTGDHPIVLTGLTAYVNATVTKADGTEHGPGTVVVDPGDRLETIEHYPHAFLLQLPLDEAAALAAVKAAGEAGADGLEVLKAAAEDAQTPAPKRKTPPTTAESQE